MTRIALCILFLTLMAISLHAQAANDAVVLTRLLNEFLAGAGRNDAAVHDRFWAEDLIYTRSSGVRIDKEELMKGVRSAPAAKSGGPVTVYTAEDIKIHQYGDAAVVAFRLVITTTKSDGTKTVGNNLNTGTFVKRAGRWQAVAWQSTIVPKTEPTDKAGVQSPTVKPTPEATPATTKAESTTNAAGARIYLIGPRGGCYYLNSRGKKVYVDHSYCK